LPGTDFCTDQFFEDEQTRKVRDGHDQQALAPSGMRVKLGKICGLSKVQGKGIHPQNWLQGWVL
jgi:hypothetical protein